MIISKENDWIEKDGPFIDLWLNGMNPGGMRSVKKTSQLDGRLSDLSEKSKLKLEITNPDEAIKKIIEVMSETKISTVALTNISDIVEGESSIFKQKFKEDKENKSSIFISGVDLVNSISCNLKNKLMLIQTGVDKCFDPINKKLINYCKENKIQFYSLKNSNGRPYHIRPRFDVNKWRDDAVTRIPLLIKGE